MFVERFKNFSIHLLFVLLPLTGGKRALRRDRRVFLTLRLRNSQDMCSLKFCLLLILVNRVDVYMKVRAADYDLYGIKVALNDRLMVRPDNLLSIWNFVVLTNDTSLSCTANYTLTTCDFVYSVVTPVTNNRGFAYNCIDSEGRNVIGRIAHVDLCDFRLMDERIVGHYLTQENFVIDIDGEGTGVYGFADDFVLYYALQPTPLLIVWPNTLGISPRAMDIGSSNGYAVVVGYCQQTPSKAGECGALMQLNRSLACPYSKSDFPFSNVLTYPWNDPRATHFVTQSRAYAASLVMSVSVAWHAQLVLVGIQAVNSVLLYALNNTQLPISVRQNGIGFSGYGKSVAWLDEYGHKAAILANTYSFSTYEWISSSLHVYNILADGFSDQTPPILVYPNSQQILHPTLLPWLLRITASPAGSVAVLDVSGNGIAILAAPPGAYASTNTSGALVSAPVPCNLGTYRDFTGIELCHPCPSANRCALCASPDAFCPYGAVGEISYSAFEPIHQVQEYPESPENTVFDDLLLQNMFTFNTHSRHCMIVSPLTWVLVVVGLGCIVAVTMSISELVCPTKQTARDRAKKLFRRIDLVGEGEVRCCSCRYSLVFFFSFGSVA